MLAATAAGLVIIIFNIAYSVLASRLAAPVNTSAISPAKLEQLPLQIGNWTGKEAPLEKAIVLATDTDAHVSRIYSKSNTAEYVSLYIAYGVRARDLMPHRPEVCYTGAGWTLIDKYSKKLPLSNKDEIELPCNTYTFSRGALSTNKTLVLDYYIVDGQYSSDVSLLRSKAWRGSGTIRYVAQVQITAPITVNQNASSVEKTICTFAAESALPILTIFESKEDTQFSDEIGHINKNLRGTGSD
ncbi:MAG: EpsI family protein [Sedimentisphaerales bacterium]|nr:EpsI family protein [Sedimentisphaerales bacterium]